MADNASQLLEAAAALSREFGTDAFVQAGGGNTSAKDARTLWIKPSGTILREVEPGQFVAMDRTTLGRLYDARPPEDATAREALVKEMVLAAVRPEQAGRPSVEAALHDSFQATFVVHTHPALANGMTCARDAGNTCRALFPDALWLGYVEPGYTISMRVRAAVGEYAEARGAEPVTVFLGNHGLVVAGDTPQAVRATHAEVLGRLAREYATKGIRLDLDVTRAPSDDTVKALTAQMRQVLGPEDAACVGASGRFAVAEGPISPDHIVYMKGHALIAEPTADAVAAFRTAHGYAPRIIACEAGVFAVGTTQANADNAMALARDGALTVQLAEAFGGIRYLDAAAEAFIDNWEVEAYRRKLAAGD